MVFVTTMHDLFRSASRVCWKHYRQYKKTVLLILYYVVQVVHSVTNTTGELKEEAFLQFEYKKEHNKRNNDATPIN